MVAGDLGSITDTYTTGSGRKVDLAIYCAHGKEEQCAWAMDSLKRAMAWDEERASNWWQTMISATWR
jgi:aminopeptidase N